MNHTPGPWKLETVKTSIGVCHKIGEFSCCIYDDYRQPNQETDKLANARLIAAAPEMFDMLVSLHSEECAKDSFPGRVCDLCVLLNKISGTHALNASVPKNDKVPE